MNKRLIDELHTFMNFFPVTSNREAIARLLNYTKQQLQRKGLQVKQLGQWISLSSWQKLHTILECSVLQTAKV